MLSLFPEDQPVLNDQDKKLMQVMDNKRHGVIFFQSESPMSYGDSRRE